LLPLPRLLFPSPSPVNGPIDCSKPYPFPGKREGRSPLIWMAPQRPRGPPFPYRPHLGGPFPPAKGWNHPIQGFHPFPIENVPSQWTYIVLSVYLLKQTWRSTFLASHATRMQFCPPRTPRFLIQSHSDFNENRNPLFAAILISSLLAFLHFLLVPLPSLIFFGEVMYV